MSREGKRSLRMSRPGDRGQTTLEYLGLVLLVAAIVIALLSLGLGQSLANGIERAICRITNGPGLVCGPAPTGENPLTPLERATRGDYVALGDSYSSGEGGSKFAPGTNRDDPIKNWLDEHLWWPGDVKHNLCHRSKDAYAHRVYDEFNFQGELEFRACSGAKIEDLYPGDQGKKGKKDHVNEGESPQLRSLDEDTSFVTVSIGGNNAKFAEVVRACIKQGLNPLAHCRDTMGEKTRRDIRRLRDDLVRLYDKIQQQAPNARVVVVGYPRMFPEHPTDGSSFIDPADQRWMNDMARLLNNVTRQAAREAGVEFVDVYNALDGHEIGTEDPWINDLSFEIENRKPFDMGSFHPNDEGQKAIAKRVKEQIRKGAS